MNYELEKEMWRAIYYNKIDKVKNLVKDGYEINHQNEFGFWEYWIEGVSFFLKKGERFGRKGEENTSGAVPQNENDLNTPLHTAIAFERLDIIKYLITNGANLTICNRFDQTAFECDRYFFSNTWKFIRGIMINENINLKIFQPGRLVDIDFHFK